MCMCVRSCTHVPFVAEDSTDILCSLSVNFYIIHHLLHKDTSLARTEHHTKLWICSLGKFFSFSSENWGGVSLHKSCYETELLESKAKESSTRADC